MKRSGRGSIIILVLLTGILPSSLWPGPSEKYKTIEFQGLKNLSKYAIVRGIASESGPEGIVLERQLLEDRLKSLPLVKSFSISRKGEGMVIKVTERQPFFPLVLSQRGRDLIIETDKEGRLLGTNTLFDTTRPLVFIGDGDYKKGTFSHRLKGLTAFLMTVEEELPSLFRELREVHFYGKGTLKVKLRGRKTLFTVASNRTDFVRLQNVAAYLDRRGHYPTGVTIGGDSLIIR